ncbi:MAG: DUF2161 domain-containing phosphodiesterase [Pseudomonadota bacterium]
MSSVRETDLYPPLKAFLQAQGYEVKAEVGAADLVACRVGEDPLIIEMKAAFALKLFHQGIARQAVTDLVYLAVPRASGRPFQKSLRDNISMARRLGLGLITVRLRDGLVEVHADPGPYQPRKSARRKALLLREFARRSGDPNLGGQGRRGLVTAYRQDALRVAEFLSGAGPSRGAAVAKATGVTRATRMMADNHYGWFERVERGTFTLTEWGMRACKDAAKR